MAKRKNEPIASWQDGDAVTGFALLARKELRQDRAGKSYLDLELVDASGWISGKAWSDSPALEGDFESHDFVAFEGTVKEYRHQLQVSLSKCRRTAESDRQYGFDPDRLIPTTKEDIGELWRRLEGILGTRVERPAMQRLARETLEAHGPRLREHPAAKTIHHAYRGGLLEHVVSMAELALQLTAHYPELDADLLLLGVLFHDLGKLEELGAMPANDYSEAGRLVGHVVIGRDLLRERCAAIPDFPASLQLQLEHLVLSHQGHLEFGSPVEPMTAEAIALHFLDDLDSKLNQLRTARDQGGGLRYLRGFRRYLLLPVEPAAEAPAAAAEEPAGAELQARLDL